MGVKIPLESRRFRMVEGDRITQEQTLGQVRKGRSLSLLRLTKPHQGSDLLKEDTGVVLDPCCSSEFHLPRV